MLVVFAPWFDLTPHVVAYTTAFLSLCLSCLSVCLSITVAHIHTSSARPADVAAIYWSAAILWPNNVFFPSLSFSVICTYATL